MDQYLIDKQISLQYLTQLLQNGGYQIIKYERRCNLLNSSDIHYKHLLSIFRQFQQSIDYHSRKFEIMEESSNFDENEIIQIDISDSMRVRIPRSIVKTSMSRSSYDLIQYSNQISASAIRRVLFLIVSGFIGFDDNERVEIIKVAFLLEFDGFFEYLSQPNELNNKLLTFQEQDESLIALGFMWETSVSNSMRYKSFFSRILSLNPKLYKSSNEELSPNILRLDIIVIETQFLPALQTIFQNDPTLTTQQRHLYLKQIIEYYEIYNGRNIFYPDLDKLLEESVVYRVNNQFESLLGEFECPICFLPFQNCHTSKCGHSFCKSCLEDSIEKFGCCPVCQQKIFANQVFRNFHLEKIRETTDLERQEKQNREISHIKNLSTFKSQFQKTLQTNIINCLVVSSQSLLEMPEDLDQEAILELKDRANVLSCIQNVNNNNNIFSNSSNDSYHQLQILKKQIEILVYTTFDQIMSSKDIQS